MKIGSIVILSAGLALTVACTDASDPTLEEGQGPGGQGGTAGAVGGGDEGSGGSGNQGGSGGEGGAADPDEPTWLEPVALPDCDQSDPAVAIIDEDSDWDAINDPAITVFCVTPGDYTGAGPIELTAEGSAEVPRWIRYSGPVDSTLVHPVQMAEEDRALVRGLRFEGASHWKVHGLVSMAGSRTNPSNANIRLVGASDNLLDRMLVQHGVASLVAFGDGSHRNVLQRSVVRYTEPQSFDRMCITIKGQNGGTRDNRIVQNEIYDCAGDGIHVGGCGYWDESGTSCGYPWNGGVGIPGDSRGTVIADNDLYVTPELGTACGGCNCYENAIDVKHNLGDDEEIGPEDWMRIEGNRMWDACADKWTALVVHYDPSDYLLVRDNVIFDAGSVFLAAKTASPETEMVNRYSFINNVLSGIDDAAFILSRVSQGFEYYGNVIVELGGPVISGYGASADHDLRCNVIIDAPGFASGVEATGDYNAFYAAEGAAAPHDLSLGGAADAQMADLCFTWKIWTAPEEHCLSNAATTAASPHVDLCDPNLGSMPGLGVNDSTDPSFFAPATGSR